MSILNNNIKRVVAEEYHDEDSDILGNVSGHLATASAADAAVAGATEDNSMEAEKRIRREIANSNERRRMQSINAGFQSLRTLLPHHEGEKLSKAAILQQTAEYIYNLEQEKTRLLSQNCQLMRQVQQHEGGDVPAKKRKTELLVAVAGPAAAESSDEGVGSLSSEPVGLVAVVPAAAELAELRRGLERERALRAHLEEQLRSLEQQLYGGYTETDPLQEEHELDMQLVAADSLPPVAHTQTVVCEPPLSRSPSPSPGPGPGPAPEVPTRLPSALEAAIKAEPKVEVERLPSPSTPHAHDDRIYVNTSRQNLETIVEAIRHLEGDHLFGDEPQQDAPLALINKAEVKVEVDPYLHYRSVASVASVAASSVTSVQQQQQSRPGVIVVKQHS